jgi:galactose mutarotase-like enzyme
MMSQAGIIGSKEENVLIQAGGCEVTIFPQLGGKIASIRVSGQELLQAPLAPYGPRTQTMGFDEGDASGWDECLPSVASCTVETAAGKVPVPDHGDLWRQVWKTTAKTANSTTMRAECFSLPLAVERTATLIETKNGWRLSLLYKVTNTGTSPSPWSWAAHPLFTAEAGDRIVLPKSIRELRIEGSGGNRLGQGGDKVAWPVATLAKGGQTDLSVAEEPTTGIGDKLFSGRLTAAENFCALERPKAGLRIRFGIDPAMTPYLGLWICYGGWPDKPGPKQVCVAMEPSTAPVDSLAIGGPWSLVLPPGESYSWPMIVDLETLQDVNPHA